MELEAIQPILTEPWGRTISKGFSPTLKTAIEVQEFLCHGQEQADCYLGELRKVGDMDGEKGFAPIIDMDYILELHLIRLFVHSPPQTRSQPAPP